MDIVKEGKRTRHVWHVLVGTIGDGPTVKIHVQVSRYQRQRRASETAPWITVAWWSSGSRSSLGGKRS